MIDLILFIIFILVLYWWFLTRLPKDFPPGPRFPIPILGDNLSLGDNITMGIANLTEKYGNIVGMWMGPLKTVIISDFDMATVS